MGAKTMLQNRCPKCKKGQVFHNSNLFSPLQLTAMNERCPECNKNFFPEIGFYWGAMFASYGIACIEFILTFLACYLAGNELFDYNNLWITLLVMLVLFPFNFRLSRLIWLYLFG